MNSTLKYSQLKVVILILTFFASFSFFGQGDTEEVMETSMVRTHEDKDLQWGPCPSFMPEGCTIAVLHGDPSKKNVDVFFKVPANYEIPEHWHVTYEGEKAQIMKVGTYAFGPSTKPHTAKCGDKDPCVIFIAFEEPLDAFPMVLKQ